MRPSVAVVALLLALPLAAAGGTTGAEQLRVVARDVASPFPVSKVALFDDAAVFRVDLDAGAVVVVDAESDPDTPFYVRYHPWDRPETQAPVPSSRQSPTLSGAKATSWRVEIDPAAGVDVRIAALFHGHLGDRDGRAWSFTLTDVSDGSPCAAGACLP